MTLGLQGTNSHGAIEDGGSIKERLDRGICNSEWRLLFPKAVILHLGAINSDHCPLLLDSNPTDYLMPHLFRFVAAWLRDPRCFEVIRLAWKKVFYGCSGLKLCRKQRATTSALKRWNKDEFGYCQTRISELTSQIEVIQSKEVSVTNARIKANLQSELNEWLTRNDLIWKQKSREIWLRNGDRNTRFFHLSTIIRRRQDSIDTIRSDFGDWIIEKKDIYSHIEDKFKSLFTEEEISCPPDLGNLMLPVISPEDNAELCKILSAEEIKNVIFNMQSLKAPGPDGLPPLFYKQSWHIVGHSVIKAVQDFFIEGKMHAELNNTLIVLIPKISNPSSINHYRLISLCNVVYKAISKLLVAKLRPMLDTIITPCQSAFVPGRWIGENQVIVKELLHSFKTRKVKEGFVAVKVDLQKAYDRINWGFLKTVISQLGFAPTFIN